MLLSAKDFWAMGFLHYKVSRPPIPLPHCVLLRRECVWPMAIVQCCSIWNSFLKNSSIHPPTCPPILLPPTGKDMADKCVASMRSVLEERVTDFTYSGASSGLTKKAGIIHNCQRGIIWAFVRNVARYTELHLSPPCLLARFIFQSIPLYLQPQIPTTPPNQTAITLLLEQQGLWLHSFHLKHSI